MSDLERSIHPSHQQGMLAAIREATAVNNDGLPVKLLNALVAPGVTYQEIQAITERPITRALYRVSEALNVEVPEMRVQALVDLFPLLSPDLRVCRDCGCLDIAFKAGRWNRESGTACSRCKAPTARSRSSRR